MPPSNDGLYFTVKYAPLFFKDGATIRFYHDRPLSGFELILFAARFHFPALIKSGGFGAIAANLHRTPAARVIFCRVIEK